MINRVAVITAAGPAIQNVEGITQEMVDFYTEYFSNWAEVKTIHVIEADGGTIVFNKDQVLGIKFYEYNEKIHGPELEV